MRVHLAADEQILVDLVDGTEGIGGGTVHSVCEQQDRNVDYGGVQIA